MRTRSECEMGLLPPAKMNVVLAAEHCLVPIGGTEQKQHPRVCGNAVSVQLDIRCCHPDRQLHRRITPQRRLDQRGNQRRVASYVGHQARLFRQQRQNIPDQVSRRICPAFQQRNRQVQHVSGIDFATATGRHENTQAGIGTMRSGAPYLVEHGVKVCLERCGPGTRIAVAADLQPLCDACMPARFEAEGRGQHGSHDRLADILHDLESFALHEPHDNAIQFAMRSGLARRKPFRCKQPSDMHAQRIMPRGIGCQECLLIRQDRAIYRRPDFKTVLSQDAGAEMLVIPQYGPDIVKPADNPGVGFSVMEDRHLSPQSRVLQVRLGQRAKRLRCRHEPTANASVTETAEAPNRGNSESSVGDGPASMNVVMPRSTNARIPGANSTGARNMCHHRAALKSKDVQSPPEVENARHRAGPVASLPMDASNRGCRSGSSGV
ncbi:hypothetical protein CO2235_U590118 [Cupriavidus oxalaticus]|uniref:Uncharacterized protein n=1 Tax=Cupriavidus oxalaticus TaxID=96344 RepID=A0A375FRA8_9BURK|nr:hypothetical protein CO2235_U590118 [Cupriavidus oxalaticus]